MTNGEKLSFQEKEMIQVALKERVKKFFTISSISNVFRTIWGDVYEEEALLDEQHELDLSELEKLLEIEGAEEKLDEGIQFGRAPDKMAQSIAYEEPVDWDIGLSSEFIKSIKKVDKKLKGRILDALGLLSKDPVPIPPLNEQVVIIKYLNIELNKLQNLCGKAESLMTFLKEYRTTLISDVVTGKIDVRDEVIP